MAFALYASTGDTTTQLNDGAPFRLESVEGLSGAAIVRHQQRGPLQSGVTDLGFRLAAGELTINLVFTAADDATLDTYRETLLGAFRPLNDIVTFLTVQRDDNEPRTLRVHRAGELTIALTPELRPGHTHRATLVLRAANPLWQSNTVTAGTVGWTAGTAWATAGTAIGAGIGLETAEFPADDEGYSFSGGNVTDNWAVAFTTTKDTATTGTASVFRNSSSGRFSRITTLFYPSPAATGTVWPGPTTINYHVVERRNGTAIWRYWNGTALQTHFASGTVANTLQDLGTLRRGWLPEIPRLRMMKNVTVDQLNALGPYILNQLPGSVTLVNEGDVDAYPVLFLQGPMTDPVIVNQSAGGTINLTGGTIPANETWTVDLRDGNKTLTDQAGVNQLPNITSAPMGMASFTLAPAPVVSGGTNVLVLTGGSVGTAATFRAEITNQYVSF